MERSEAIEAISRIAKEREQIAEKVEKLQTRLIALDTDLESVKRVWELLGDGEPLESPAESSPITFHEAVRQRGELITRIREFISFIAAGDEFTSEDVREFLNERHPALASQTHKSSIPGTLSQLARSGEITQLRKGVGREHSIFSKSAQGRLTPTIIAAN